MKEQLDDDTLIRDYADGMLSEAAQAAFEQRLKVEPDLQAELDLYLALKAMDNVRLKKQLMEVAASAQLAPAPPASGVLSGARSRWWAAAAALALLLTALWWWRQPGRPDAAQMAMQYLSTPYPPPVHTMGTVDTLRSPALQTALMAYRTGDFAGAANQLSSLATAPDASDETLFYAGEALLQRGDAGAAIALFDRVRPGYWREAADWRSALALIRTGDTARAKPLLEGLRATNRKAQAEALLEVLK